MKRFLIGVFIGLIIGWITVPIASALLPNSVIYVGDDEDFRSSHAYKWYLTQILQYMKSIDKHLQSVEENTKAVKDKLHA